MKHADIYLLSVQFWQVEFSSYIWKYKTRKSCWLFIVCTTVLFLNKLILLFWTKIVNLFLMVE